MNAGSPDPTAVNLNDENSFPSGYSISANYPNPFNTVTTIDFQLPENSHVKITVFDLRGEIVATLINKQMNAGSYSANWNGLNTNGSPVPSGVYFYRIVVSGFTQTRKMVLLK